MALCMLPMLAACDTIYFHDAEREASLTQAKADLAAAAPDALFEQQRTYLDDLAKAEREAVMKNFTAARDLNLAIWLSPQSVSSGASESSTAVMTSVIERRGRELAGNKWRAHFSSNALNRTDALFYYEQAQKLREKIDFDVAKYKKLGQNLPKPAVGGEQRFVELCDNLVDEDGTYTNPHTLYDPFITKEEFEESRKFEARNQLNTNCESYFGRSGTQWAIKEFSSTRAKLVSDLQNSGDSSLIVKLDDDATAAKKRLKEIEDEAKRLKCALEADQKAYVDRKKSAGETVADFEAAKDKYLEVIKARVGDLFNLDKTPSENEKANASDAAKDCGENKKAGSKTKAEKKSTSDAVKAKALAYINQFLAKKLINTTETKIDDVVSGLSTDQAKLLNAIFDANAKIKQAKNKGELNAMLTALAYSRYLHTRAETALAYEKEKESIAERRLNSVITEGYWLSQSASALKTIAENDCAQKYPGLAEILTKCSKGNPEIKGAVSSALIAYVTASSTGSLGERLGRHEKYVADRKFALSMEEDAGTVQFAVLQPLADQMEAFGKGGIKQQTIIGLIQALGIFTIAAN